MKKVVILHSAYWEQAMGGAELQISYLVEKLKKTNVEVYYIFEDKGDPIENKLDIHLRPVKKINFSKKFGDRWILYKNKVNRCLEEIKPDVIYTRTYSSWSGIATDYALKNSIIHIWAIAHDNDIPQSLKKISLLRPFDVIAKKMMLTTILNATNIIAQNNYQKSILKKHHNRNSLLITQSTHICAENLINKNFTDIKVLWIANLKPTKQPEKFIEIAREFQSIDGIFFKMIGRTGAYKKVIEEANSEIPNFQYLGELKNEEVNKLLCSHHILINTSKSEGFSNTFVQAWMRKVLVISMNSNPDEILTSNNIGYIEPDLKKIVELLKSLIKEKELIQAMGNSAYTYAIEHHSTEKNLNKIIKLMNL